ncbi:hypothetical protein DSECCO2_488490 [anaerobic digester metagenome]
MNIKKYILLSFIIICAIVAISLISNNSEARTCVWDGEGADNLASNPLNWNLNLAPIENDSILFNGTSVKNCVLDINIKITNFTINSPYSGIITQLSLLNIGNITQNSGTLTFSNSYETYLFNSTFVKNSGTLSSFGNFHLIGNCSFNIIGSSWFPTKLYIENYLLIIDLTGGATYLENNGTLDIRDSTFLVHIYHDNVFINNGVIIGTTSVKFTSYGKSVTLSSFGIIEVDVNFNLISVATGSWEVKLLTNISTNNNILISSASSTKTLTLNTNNYYISVNYLTITTRGILKCNNSIIHCNSLIATSGTVISETSTFIIEENGNINVAITNTLYNLNIKNIINFQSNCNVTNSITFINNLIQRDYGLYYNDIRQNTVSSNHEGIITISPFLINVSKMNLYLKPLISLNYINIEDNTIAINDFYHAEYISDIPVSWSLNTTATWISFENGNISGIANVTDTFYYTITATSIDGEVTTYTGYIYVASVYDLQMFTFIIIIWIILMIVFLLISLKYTEWGILGGIIWLLAGLLEFLDLNTTLGLIIISIGMFIMLYGAYELFKR